MGYDTISLHWRLHQPYTSPPPTPPLGERTAAQNFSCDFLQKVSCFLQKVIEFLQKVIEILQKVIEIFQKVIEFL